MPGDYSRFSDNPGKRFAALLMQQGRVQLDADWNEAIAILKRRVETEANDVFGPAAVPRATTPDGFAIAVTTTNGKPDLTIAPGRMYVDGVLAECFAGDAATYQKQPYVIRALPDLAGDVLVYLDVWQREVTAVEDPDLLDSALGGIDTGTRLETVWQVKARTPDQGQPATCDVDFGKLFPPSGGRLTTQTQKPSEAPDPCSLPDAGGYQGVDNRLYRVEVHDPATGRIKWSRDNGSVASSVLSMAHGADTTLTVVRVGRDADLGFRPNDWVEITDDARELSQTPGKMAKVRSVDAATRAITLVGSIAAEGFDVNGAHALRVRRWDQIDTSDGFDGAGLVTPKVNGFTTLENGVQVKLTTVAGGALRFGDAWVFAARATDGKVGPLTDAPPIAIQHHYAALATVKGIGGGGTPNVSDCRTKWPPIGTGGDDCSCVVCVEAKAHNDGTFTIAEAIEQAKHSGGTVCLGVGTFEIGEAGVVIEGAQAIRLRGQGEATRLHSKRFGSVVTVRSSSFVQLSDFAIVAENNEVQAGVQIEDSLYVDVERLWVQVRPIGEASVWGFGVVLSGYTAFVNVRHNLLRAPVGVVAIASSSNAAKRLEARRLRGAETAVAAAVAIQDNLIRSSFYGAYLGDQLVLDLLTVTGNVVGAPVGLHVGGVTSTGPIRVEGNFVGARSSGIVLLVNDAVVRDNVVVGNAGAAVGDATSPSGVVLDGGSADASVGTVRGVIEGNQIRSFRSYGVALAGTLDEVVVRGNQIDAVGGGIVMEDGATAAELVIESNVLSQIGASAPLAATVGIGAVSTTSLVVRANVLRDVGAGVTEGTVTGIRAMQAVNALIDDNALEAMGPPDSNVPRTVGIDVLGYFNDVRVSGNRVRIASPGLSLPYAGILVHAGGDGAVDAVSKARFVAVDAERALVATSDYIKILHTGQQNVDVSGNSLNVSPSSLPIVSVLAGGATVARGNRVGHFRFRPVNDPVGAPSGTSPTPTVQLTASTLIAADNQINAFANVTSLALATFNEKHRVTVLGNVATSGITLNGGPLPDPWKPLNIGA